MATAVGIERNSGIVSIPCNMPVPEVFPSNRQQTFPILFEAYVGTRSLVIHPISTRLQQSTRIIKKKSTGKVHPCTGTEALYRPYGL
jgi:hypothetical protein